MNFRYDNLNMDHCRDGLNGEDNECIARDLREECWIFSQETLRVRVTYDEVCRAEEGRYHVKQDVLKTSKKSHEKKKKIPQVLLPWVS